MTGQKELGFGDVASKPAVSSSAPATASGNLLVRPLASFIPDLPADWAEALAPVLQSDVFASLAAYVDERVASGERVYPADQIGRAHV